MPNGPMQERDQKYPQVRPSRLFNSGVPLRCVLQVKPSRPINSGAPLGCVLSLNLYYSVTILSRNVLFTPLLLC